MADPADEFIDIEVQNLLAAADPLAAELWASRVVSLFDELRTEERDELPPFEALILERCAERVDLPSLVTATALSAVVPPPLDTHARRIADGIAALVEGPSWLAGVGAAEPTRAWSATDALGAQESLMIAYGLDGPGHGEHTLVVLVDHDLDGQAVDVWLGTDPDEIAGAWSREDGMIVTGLHVGDAVRRLRDAMQASELASPDAGARTQDFTHHRALVWGRLHRAG